MRPLTIQPCTIRDTFWLPRLACLRAVTIPRMLDAFEHPDGGAFRNFDRVRDGETGGHAGFPWYDGLVYQTLTAASRLVEAGRDPGLERRVEGYVRRIAAAQEAVGDGYLNTWTLLMAPETRWGGCGGNLRWQHELYNLGCLMEAGVSHHRATGARALLDVALRAAAHLTAIMGPRPRRNIVPAHPLPEMAAVELAAYLEAIGERPRGLLALARFWLDARGRHHDRATHVPRMQAYAQDHAPVARQTEAVGHAVRATLLYTGLASVARATGRRRYLAQARLLWKDVVTRKMAVTGGVGALQEEEMFGPAYYLPHGAYLETCAAVGMVFWSRAMNLAEPRGEYGDVFELALYNNALAGISLDGRRFFYRNPLVSAGDHHRWDWHPCPCCPPMLTKLLGDLGRTVYAGRGSTLFVSQYIAGEVTHRYPGGVVGLRQQTRYPWDGRVELLVTASGGRPVTLALRIPGWCRGWRITVNGEAVAGAPLRHAPGYTAVRRPWAIGDRLVLDLPMPVMLIEANPYVEACRGRVAIQRGPLVYCLEEEDNPDPAAIRLPTEPRMRAVEAPDLLGGVVAIRGVAETGAPFTAIPYYTWDNRSGERRNRMTVWIPRRGDWDDRRMVWTREQDLASWDDVLYRVAWRGGGP